MPTTPAIQSRLRDHKDWLIGLRQDPRMTLAKIQTHLRDQKGVTASLNQLDAYLKSLGQRKYLSPREWGIVLRALDSQKAFGRSWDVDLSGRHITDESLRRRRKYAKYVHSVAPCLEQADQLLNQLPDGVTLKRRLPQDTSGDSQQHSVSLRATTHAISCAGQDEIIGMRLDDVSTGIDSVSGPSAAVPETREGPSCFASQPAKTSTSNQAQLVVLPANMGAYTAPPIEPFEGLDWSIGSPPVRLNYDPEDIGMDFVDPYSFPGSDDFHIWARPHSPYAFLPGLEPQGPESYIGSTEISYENYTCIVPSHQMIELGLLEPARLVGDDPRSVTDRRDRSTQYRRWATAEERLESLQLLVSIDVAEEQFLGPYYLTGRPALPKDAFVQVFLFSIVNDFAGKIERLKRRVMQVVKQHELVRSTIFDHLRNRTCTVFSTALAEKLLEPAIEAYDANTVHDLLALKTFKIDDILCMDDGKRRTPVEKAARLRHFDITDLLLRFGADANKTYEHADPLEERGALECAIGLWGQYRPIDIKLVDLLLENGATVSTRLAGAAIRWGDIKVIERLMARLSPSEHKFFFTDMVAAVAEYLNNDEGYEVARKVIWECREIHANMCLKSTRKLEMAIAIAMARAARRGNKELMELLLPYGGQMGLDLALIGAARSGCHSLVRQLIRHGARADGPAYKIESCDRFSTTPLAETIRGNDTGLMDLIGEGAWNKIAEPGRLEAALRAVAESGNSVYLSKVLQSVPNPNPQVLTGPLIFAIRARHEEIALRLVQAGADVNRDGGKYYGRGVISPLHEALRVHSQSITWAILDSDVSPNQADTYGRMNLLEAATKYGDPEVIKALCFMGADINTFGVEPPLSTAIKSGNRSLIDLLIKIGANTNLPPQQRARFLSPLAAAVLVRDGETANYLLDHGADPADETAFLNAVTLSYDQTLLDVIFERFCNQNPKGRKGFGGSVLRHALQKHDDTLLELCLNAGFDSNSWLDGTQPVEVTVLGLAIGKHCDGRLDLISRILKAAGDPNVPTTRRKMGNGHIVQNTALLDAIFTRNLPLVEFLISEGADVRKEAKLSLKRTPLQKACEVASLSIVDLLLSHNANVNEDPAGRGGATALQLAVKAGSLTIANRLLALGANVNAPGVRVGGRSAIEYAAEYGRLSMIPLLWNAPGADLPRDQIETAITLARKNGHVACVVLLLKLSSGSQGLIDDISGADGGGRVSMFG